MRVVVLGKGLMLANIILGVLDSGADIVGVYRYEQTCNSKLKLAIKDCFSPAPELTLIKELKLPHIRCKSANSEEFRKLMLKLNVDLIIIGTWKERLRKETFDIPKIATVNVHPSLLPKYRGPNPYMQTILNGEKFSGVTLHLVNENYDCGAILKQKKVAILDTDTSKELREKSVIVARSLVSEFLNDLDNKITTPIPQNEKNSSYFPSICGDEKMLDFAKQSSIEISRTIRALHPFLPTYITYQDRFFVVNPYKFKILEKLEDAKPGDIISKNPESLSITIVCADNVAIQFEDLRLYKASLRTRKYIDKNIKIDF